MSPILFFIIFFTCTGVGKNIFTNKSSSSGFYRYFNSSVGRVKKYMNYSTLCFKFNLKLKVIYKGCFKSFVALYADRKCSDQHFVENRIEKFLFVSKL